MLVCIAMCFCVWFCVWFCVCGSVVVLLQVVADRERKVLSHVTGEAVERLSELARAGEAQRLAVRAELDGLQRATSGAVDRADLLEARLDHVHRTVGGYEERLAVVEEVAAGLVPLLPTGEELCQLCVAFEDKVMRTGTTATAVTLTSAALPAVHLNMALDDETSQQLTLFALRLAEHVARSADKEVLCGGVREPKAPPTGSGPLWTGAGRQLASKDSHGLGLSHSHSHATGNISTGTGSGNGNTIVGTAGGGGTGTGTGGLLQTLAATVALYEAKGSNNAWGATATATATGSGAIGGGLGLGVGGWTVEEEVAARRDALVRAFEASFVQALRRAGGHTNVSTRGVHGWV